MVLYVYINRISLRYTILNNHSLSPNHLQIAVQYDSCVPTWTYKQHEYHMSAVAISIESIITFWRYLDR